MEGANDVNQNLNINNSIKQIHQENYIGKNNINIKYPFSGIAPNLIDKFLILGYEQRTIDITARSQYRMFPTSRTIILTLRRTSLLTKTSMTATQSKSLYSRLNGLRIPQLISQPRQKKSSM